MNTRLDQAIKSFQEVTRATTNLQKIDLTTSFGKYLPSWVLELSSQSRGQVEYRPGYYWIRYKLQDGSPGAREWQIATYKVIAEQHPWYIILNDTSYTEEELKESYEIGDHIPYPGEQ